jgi:hypothetical protein
MSFARNTHKKFGRIRRCAPDRAIRSNSSAPCRGLRDFRFYPLRTRVSRAAPPGYAPPAENCRRASGASAFIFLPGQFRQINGILKKFNHEQHKPSRTKEQVKQKACAFRVVSDF